MLVAVGAVKATVQAGDERIYPVHRGLDGDAAFEVISAGWVLDNVAENVDVGVVGGSAAGSSSCR